MNVEYLYTKEQAAELREKLIAKHIFSQVKAAFEKYERLNSATFLVAQYWADEANDAVHYTITFSVLPTPVIQLDVDTEEKEYDRVNLPELPTDGEILDSLEVNTGAGVNTRWWDSNGEAIPAFAAFCKEYASQEIMGWLDVYSPYAVFRRKGADIEPEIVGQMLRPWADGMRPEEWEED
jgi:hypothetical protein